MRFNFTGPWTASTIGNNFHLTSGLTPSTKEKIYFNSGAIPWINSGELKNKYISKTDNLLTYDAVCKHNLTIYPINTMIIAIYGLEAVGVRGKASITKMKTTISQSCMAFEPKGNIQTEFMYYLYKKKSQILGIKYAQGTKQQNLSSDLIARFKIHYPSRLEQQKITDFLSLIDDRIDTQNKIISDYEAQKKSIINDYFNKNSNKWNKYQLSKILKEYSEYKIKDDNIIHATLSKDGISPKTERYDRDFLVKDVNKKYKVTYYDDICYNPANLKFGVITRNNFGTCIISPIYITYKVNNYFDPKFIELLVTTSKFIKKARKFEQGTVYERMSVNSNDLLSMHVSVPSINEQNIFVRVVEVFNDKIRIEKKLLELYQKQKLYLLKNMFI